jgi:hypothetical protein
METTKVITMPKYESVSWVGSLVKRHADKLETVEAFPIERERAQVTFEELETYYKKLEVFSKYFWKDDFSKYLEAILKGNKNLIKNPI